MWNNKLHIKETAFFVSVNIEKNSVIPQIAGAWEF